MFLFKRHPVLRLLPWLHFLVALAPLLAGGSSPCSAASGAQAVVVPQPAWQAGQRFVLNFDEKILRASGRTNEERVREDFLVEITAAGAEGARLKVTRFKWTLGFGDENRRAVVDHVYKQVSATPIEITLGTGAASLAITNQREIDALYENVVKDMLKHMASESGIPLSDLKRTLLPTINEYLTGAAVRQQVLSSLQLLLRFSNTKMIIGKAYGGDTHIVFPLTGRALSGKFQSAVAEIRAANDTVIYQTIESPYRDPMAREFARFFKQAARAMGKRGTVNVKQVGMRQTIYNSYTMTTGLPQSAVSVLEVSLGTTKFYYRERRLTLSIAKPAQ